MVIILANGILRALLLTEGAPVPVQGRDYPGVQPPLPLLTALAPSVTERKRKRVPGRPDPTAKASCPLERGVSRIAVPAPADVQPETPIGCECRHGRAPSLPPVLQEIPPSTSPLLRLLSPERVGGAPAQDGGPEKRPRAAPPPRSTGTRRDPARHMFPAMPCTRNISPFLPTSPRRRRKEGRERLRLNTLMGL